MNKSNKVTRTLRALRQHPMEPMGVFGPYAIDSFQMQAILYIRQPSPYQVSNNLESQKLPYAMQERLRRLVSLFLYQYP